MSEHSSDHHVLVCHGPLSRLAIDFVIMHEVVDESLRKICHYQQN